MLMIVITCFRVGNEIEFSKSVWRHQNLNCLTVNPGVQWTPDSDCAPKIILPEKISAFLYLGKHKFAGSKLRNLP